MEDLNYATDTPNWAVCAAMLNNLGNSLGTRFDRTGATRQSECEGKNPRSLSY